jgi:hypothetical protein
MGFKTEDDRSSVTAIFPDHAGAGKAIKELKNCGLDIEKLSVVGRDSHTEDHAAGFYTRGERIRYGGKRDFLGDECWGDLAGAAFLIIPGVGPVIVAGPVANWIIGALEGSIFIGGMSALGAGLVTLGIPRRTVFKYEIAIKAGKLVLMTLGTEEDARRARRILEITEAEEINTNEMPPEPARVA